MRTCLAREASMLALADSRVCPACAANGVRTMGLTSNVFVQGVVGGNAGPVLARMMGVCIAAAFVPDRLNEQKAKTNEAMTRHRGFYDQAVSEALLGDTRGVDPGVLVAVARSGWNCAFDVSVKDPELRAKLLAAYVESAQHDAQQRGQPFDEAATRARGAECFGEFTAPLEAAAATK